MSPPENFLTGFNETGKEQISHSQNFHNNLAKTILFLVYFAVV